MTFFRTRPIMPAPSPIRGLTAIITKVNFQPLTNPSRNPQTKVVKRWIKIATWSAIASFILLMSLWRTRKVEAADTFCLRYNSQCARKDHRSFFHTGEMCTRMIYGGNYSFDHSFIWGVYFLYVRLTVNLVQAEGLIFPSIFALLEFSHWDSTRYEM